MDGPRDRPRAQALLAQAADEIGQVGLPQVEEGALFPLRVGPQAREVAPVGLQRMRRERALDPQVVEVVGVDAVAVPARARAPAPPRD